MRRDLRAADAEVARLDAAHGLVGTEDDLDRAVEVDGEVYVATLAVQVGLHVAQSRGRLLRAAAERAQEFPTQVEQTRARRLQTEFERDATRHAPRVRERVWS